jgi:LysM repeat protein
MAATIGIKVANGDFYSILEEKTAVKKRLVLTTVHNNQKSVQIDLYKSILKSMADALYIGSLVVENITSKPKGDPSIELIITSTTEGEISADSVDLGNPSREKQRLNLHLKSFEEDKTDYADFEMEDQGSRDLLKNPVSTEKERKFPWPVLIIIGLVLILVLAALWFFLLREQPAKAPALAAQAPVEQPAAQADVPPAAPAAKPAQNAAPAPAQNAAKADTPAANPPAQQAKPVVITSPPKPNPAPANRDRSSAPVYSFKVPQTIPPEGVAYSVRWGDTLWDISEAFYRNPRLYPRIVRHNEIGNPDLIVSGTKIIVPPRN